MTNELREHARHAAVMAADTAIATGRTIADGKTVAWLAGYLSAVPNLTGAEICATIRLTFDLFCKRTGASSLAEQLAVFAARVQAVPRVNSANDAQTIREVIPTVFNYEEILQ